MSDVGPISFSIDSEKIKEQITTIIHGLKTDEGRQIFLRHVLLDTDLSIPDVARPLAEDMIKNELDEAAFVGDRNSLFGGPMRSSVMLNRALIMAKRANIQDKIDEIEGRLKRIVQEEYAPDELMELFMKGGPKEEPETRESLERLLEILLIVNPERAFEVALKLGKNDLAKKLATNKVFMDWEKRGEFGRIAEACGQIGDGEKARFYASAQELLDRHGLRRKKDF